MTVESLMEILSVMEGGHDVLVGRRGSTEYLRLEAVYETDPSGRSYVCLDGGDGIVTIGDER